MKRVFASFDNLCPYNCKFCYTFGIERKEIRSIEQIVDDLSKESFDIVYVSQKNDNFADPEQGLKMCSCLFTQYQCDLMLITRNIFSEEQLEKLISLRDIMKQKGKQLYIALSLNALQSWTKFENPTLVPSPQKRISFLSVLAKNDFHPIVMLRPIFPQNIIPLHEICDIIDQVSSYVSCVVSSGVGVNPDVLTRLGMNENDFTYIENQEYLQGAIDCEIKFVNVDSELNTIEKKCSSMNLPFFKHSMDAISYIHHSFY